MRRPFGKNYFVLEEVSLILRSVMHSCGVRSTRNSLRQLLEQLKIGPLERLSGDRFSEPQSLRPPSLSAWQARHLLARDPFRSVGALVGYLLRTVVG
jgi:hypothetical protein